MGKRRIDGVFSKSSLLEIPFFQRGYVWQEENWERFLNDLKNVCITKKRLLPRNIYNEATRYF